MLTVGMIEHWPKAVLDNALEALKEWVLHECFHYQEISVQEIDGNEHILQENVAQALLFLKVLGMTIDALGHFWTG